MITLLTVVFAVATAHPSVTQDVVTENTVEPSVRAEQASDPPDVQTMETLSFEGAQASNLQPSRFDDNWQRRSSMQDATETFMWETFDCPGVASRAMLPQPSRALSQGQLSMSIGQPLQLMDSNQSVPDIGKGKGRARDFDPNQQQLFSGWDPVNVANPGQFSIPYSEDVQYVPRQAQISGLGTFSFVPDQFTPWHPIRPDYAQSNLQQGNSDLQAGDYQPTQTQAHSHAHPHPVQAAPAAPAPPLQQSSQTPVQHAYHPVPTSAQQPQGRGMLLYTQTEPQPFQHWQIRP